MIKAENFEGFKEDNEVMKRWPLRAWTDSAYRLFLIRSMHYFFKLNTNVTTDFHFYLRFFFTFEQVFQSSKLCNKWQNLKVIYKNICKKIRERY